MGGLELIDTIRRYFFLGLTGMAAIAVIIVAGYFLIYKKILKRQKNVGAGMLVWLILILCYVLMLGSVTLLSRGNSYQSGRYPLFYSYREAWYSFSMQDWRNLILNIAMFVPLGFLVPAGIGKMRKFWKTTLCGLGITVLIELTQQLTRRGMFEWDDVLNNTVGAMIGYGLFAICYLIGSKICARSERTGHGHWNGSNISGKKVICCQIPLIVTCLCYVVIFGVYQRQELGNMQSRLYMDFRKTEINVTTDQSYSGQEQTVPVYRLVQMSREESEAYAEKFFAGLGEKLDKNQTIYYEDTGVFYAEDGNTLWLDYAGLTWNYTDFATLYPEDEVVAENNDISEQEQAGTVASSEESSEEQTTSLDSNHMTEDVPQLVTDASEETIRTALQTYGITVPEGCTFSSDGDGNYTFTANQMKTEDGMYDGNIDCAYYSNGKMGTLWNRMMKCSGYKDFEIISEQEAYEKITDGKFRLWTDDSDTYDIRVGAVSLVYEKDSKDFYQPEYRFRVTINGTKDSVYIPALK